MTALDRDQTDDPSGSMARPRLRTRWVGLATATAAALVLAVSRITHAAVGPDAIAYIAVATSLKAGNGIGFFLENPLVTWPPLWPALLALGMAITGWRGDVVALLINSVVLAGCVPLGIAVARRVLASPTVLGVLAASLAVSPLLIGLTVIVQTEVVFALLVLGMILAIMRGAETRLSRWLVLAGVFTAVAFYIRYQALYVVPVLAFWLVASSWLRSRSVPAALRAGLWYSVPAVIPSAVWIARNLSVSDTAMGPRFPSDLGPVSNAAGALRTVFKFVTSIPEAPLLPSALLTATVGVIAIIWLVRVTRPETGGPRYRDRAIEAFCGWAGLLAVFIAGFTALMIVSRSLIGFDDLDIRLLSPCLVPTSILFLRYVEIVLLQDRGARSRLAGRVLLGVWLAPQVLLTLALVGPANSIVADTGYNADRAVAASSSLALDAIPEGCVTYSNNAADLYRSGFEAEPSPRTVEYKSTQPTDDLSELVERVESGQRSCLVWIEYTVDDENYSPAQLATSLRLERLASADRVTVYELSAAG